MTCKMGNQYNAGQLKRLPTRAAGEGAGILLALEGLSVMRLSAFRVSALHLSQPLDSWKPKAPRPGHFAHAASLASVPQSTGHFSQIAGHIISSIRAFTGYPECLQWSWYLCEPMAELQKEVGLAGRASVIRGGAAVCSAAEAASSVTG